VREFTIVKKRRFIDASPNFTGKCCLDAFCSLFEEKYKIQFVKAPAGIESQPETYFSTEFIDVVYAVFILSEVNNPYSFSEKIKKEYEWFKNKIGDSKIFVLAPASASYKFPDSLTTTRRVKYNDENLSEYQDGEFILARLIMAYSATCVSDAIYNRRCKAAKEIEPQIKKTVNHGKLRAILSGVGTAIRDICTQVISQIITNKIGGP
jgi:hypothetical protein